MYAKFSMFCKFIRVYDVTFVKIQFNNSKLYNLIVLYYIT